MCGIAGAVAHRSPLDTKLTERMLHAQKHRGPDDTGVFPSAFLQIGMVRLSVIDLDSPGLCPLVHSQDGVNPSHVLAFNGEIYNYLELRAELTAKGHVFRTTSDTEVLLHSYLEWGEACLDRFNGMFAFALADYDRDLLLLARDPVGEKPLYFTQDSGRFLFASEIKALLTSIPLPEVTVTDEFEAFEYATGRETLFDGVFALRPGHKLVVRGIRGNYRGQRETEYWSVVDDLYDVDPATAVDVLDELIHDAVRLRLRSDVAWGVYLSGGIDSSLIAALAEPEVAFTVHFPYGARYDEFDFARTVADSVGCELVAVRPTREDFEREFDRLVYHMDQPVGSFSAFPLYMLAREASRRVKVVLSGEGVDEMFSGYTRYLLPWHDQSAYERPELRNYHSLLDYYYGKPIDRFARLTNRGSVSDTAVKSVIAPHFGVFSDMRHAMGYSDFKLMLVTLLHMEDRAASAFGIENRSPFLDRRLVAFAFSIPGDLKIRSNVTKWIVKEVARRHLPAVVVDRVDKQGLIAPINIWMNYRGRRGEFDRNGYNDQFRRSWLRVFFQERWFDAE